MTAQTLEKTRTSSHTLDSLWQARWLGPVLGAGFAALAGVITAWAMPHDPATTAQALIVMISCLAVGLIAGFSMRSYWSLLLAPFAYVCAIELARYGAVGPTVDLPRFDETFGILALVLGRGFHGLVAFFPMIVGAGIGVRIARQMAGTTAGWSDWLWPGLGVLGIILLAISIIRSASTPPILDAEGHPLPGSIAEVSMVPVNGRDMGVLMRGQSVDNPVLLYLAGGPGQSSLPHLRTIFQDLERDFIVVSWDQRGTGKSYAALDPASDLTLEQAVSDTIALTNYLRQRFDENKIYLLGESYGTILGVLAAQQRPDLYHAFIGSGQMVNLTETDRRLYDNVLAYAAQAGDAQLDDKMRSYGEPPYADLPYGNAFVMGQYEHLYKPYTPPQSYIDRGNSAGIDQFGIMGSEYNLVEKMNVLRGLIDMFTIMYPQLQGIDFCRDAARLEVPVYMLDGQAELAARRDLALEWFDILDAPIKRMFSFENAAHAVAFEQYEAFHKILLDTILPETYR
ncbi:MAG: alpha/beta hydrolase [Caldilineales bacterium]|nr:alpha/beta hydrolase [Caldilineales bacterium]